MSPSISHSKPLLTSPPAAHPASEQYARQFADTLTRLNRLEKQRADDMLSGALMQQRFLTPSDEIERMFQPYGYTIATFRQSSGVVSGDFLCSRAINSNKAALMLGDTVENGLTAALISMRISNLVQTAPVSSPSEFLEYIHRDINGLLCSGKFVAATYAIISRNIIRLANAGQPMPILLRKGKTSEVNVSGIPLGLPLGVGQYRDIAVNLIPGDRIILYTDGVTAMENSNGELLTRCQFRTLLERYPRITVNDLLAETVSELSCYNHGQAVLNDISIVIMEYVGGNIPRPLSPRGTVPPEQLD